MTELRDRQAGFADVNGTEIHYEIAGEGAALILIHAGIADGRMWDDQFTLFAQSYRVLRYDLRGFGKTARTAENYSHHDDLVGLLKFLNIKRASLIGVSMGAAAAINFMLEHAAMVEALILVAAAVEGYKMTHQATIDQWPAIDDAIEQGDFERAAELEVCMWVDGPHRSADQVEPSVRQRVRQMLLDSYVDSGDGKAQALEPAALSRLGEIHVPTLVLTGEVDAPDIDMMADAIIASIKGAKKIVMSAVAHLPNMEKPEEFNQIVLDFLRGHL